MKKSRVLAVVMAVLMMVTLLPSMVFATAVPSGTLDGKLKVKGTCDRVYFKCRLLKGQAGGDHR